MDDCDPWFHFVYDTRWRIVAVYRVLHWKDGGGWTFDADPKERFVYHNAGLAGGGGSSYIDSVILRDRDANTAWEDEADGTLEERVYYCQNWRADVVALFGSNGHMLHQVRYDPYGVPFGISKADINADGVLDSADSSLFVTLYNSGSGTHPFADWNLDGTLNSQDPIAYLNSYNADVALGYGVLSYAYSRAGGANRKGYAGYEIDPVLTGANGRESVYHVRHRVLLSELGRWNRRDPLGYVDGMSLYEYVGSNPFINVDISGLAKGNPNLPNKNCDDVLKEAMNHPLVKQKLLDIQQLCGSGLPPIRFQDCASNNDEGWFACGFFGFTQIVICTNAGQCPPAHAVVSTLLHELTHYLQFCFECSHDCLCWNWGRSCNTKIAHEHEAYCAEPVYNCPPMRLIDAQALCQAVANSLAGTFPPCKGVYCKCMWRVGFDFEDPACAKKVSPQPPDTNEECDNQDLSCDDTGEIHVH